MSEDKKRKIKRIIAVIIIIIIIILMLVSCVFKPTETFYEFGKDLYSNLNEYNLEEGKVPEKYIDSKYSCDKVVYTAGILEFYGCEVEEDKVEKYCIYDGKNFDCNVGDKTFDVSFNSDNDNELTNEDVSVSLSYDEEDITKLLYCTTTEEKCVPSDEYKEDINLNQSSYTNKVCVKAVYSDGSYSEIICSDNYLIDKEAPIIATSVIKGTLGENGWYISDVVIENINATDELSGVKETTINIDEINYDTTGEKIIITSIDNAGNVSAKEFTIKVDKENPIVGEIIIDGTIGLNGWYTSDLNISYKEGTDETSGIDKSILSTKNVNGSIKSYDISLITYDKAGNSSETSKNVKIDKEGPIFTGITDINIKVNEKINLNDGVLVSDSISGLSGDYEIVNSNIDTSKVGEYTVTYKAVDKAGNETLINRNISITKVAFTVDFENDSEATNAWYDENLNITLDILEDVDNIKYCITSNETCNPATLYDEKISLSDEGSKKICVNAYNDGKLTETICSEVYNIDKSKPEISNILINNSVPKEWYNTDVELTSYDVVDSISGIKDVEIINETLSNETTGEYITIKVTDNAGNYAEEKVLVKIDKTAPVVNYSISGTKGSNNYYVSNVDVSTPTATDNLSGVVSVSANKTSFTEETSGTDLIITAVDKAGNIKTEIVNLKIDKTAPIIHSYDLTGNLANGWYTSIVEVENIIATDAISGVNTSALNALDVVIDYETTGTQIEFQVLDMAGHVATAVFDIKVDLKNPDSGEIVLNGTEGENGWYTSDVTVENTSGTDDISGVKESELNITIITGSTTNTTVELNTEDNAGHITNESQEVKIDKEFPLLGDLVIIGTLGSNGWYTSDVTIQNPSGIDSVSGVDYATIDIAEINGNTIGTTVNILIKDNAGNEVTFSETIKIDQTIPSISQKKPIEIENEQEVDVYSYFETSFGPSTGTFICNIIDTTSLSVGTHDLTCTATSVAGLTNVINTTIVVLDTYTLLEYVEGDGTQFIETGVPNTGDYIFESEFLVTNSSKNNGSWIVGGRLDYNYSIGIHVMPSGVYNAYGGPTRRFSPILSNNVWYKMYFTRFSLKINDITYPVVGQKLIPLEYETDIRIGGTNVLQSGAVDNRNLVGKIKSFKITDATNGEVIRDYIPVKLNSTGEMGLYDLVENKFYGSNGTGKYTGLEK